MKILAQGIKHNLRQKIFFMKILEFLIKKKIFVVEIKHNLYPKKLSHRDFNKWVLLETLPYLGFFFCKLKLANWEKNSHRQKDCPGAVVFFLSTMN